MLNPGEGRVLVLLLDTSIGMWEQLRRNDLQKTSAGLSQLNQANFISQVLQFLNTYLMMQEGNKATVFAVDGSGSHLLHTPPVSSNQSKSKQHATQSAADEVLHMLLLHLQANSPGQAELPCWSAALSRALCLIHKQQQATTSARSEASKPRILCITGSPDVPSQYIASMNAIFSAQREGIVIDTCMVGNQDSAFLQQAAHISDGLYLRPKHTGALLQYLLTVFGADTHTRSFMQMPKLTGVDFRASCFCHKDTRGQYFSSTLTEGEPKTIDMGYVCSVCLSIFCQKLAECSTCGTSFTTSAPATQTARIT